MIWKVTMALYDIRLATIHGHSLGATGFEGFLPAGVRDHRRPDHEDRQQAWRSGHHQRPCHAADREQAADGGPEYQTHAAGRTDQRHAACAVSGADDGRRSRGTCCCAAGLFSSAVAYGRCYRTLTKPLSGAFTIRSKFLL